MYCRKCGEMLSDHEKFCHVCGESVEETAGLNSVHTHQQYCAHGTDMPSPSIGMGEAFKLYFKRYADFSSRSRRSEYWWATLAISLISYAIAFVIPMLSTVWMLATLVPSLAMCVRRLHDIGKSGWWYLMIFVPLVGSILLIVWFCQDSGPDNQWGRNPKFM